MWVIAGCMQCTVSNIVKLLKLVMIKHQGCEAATQALCQGKCHVEEYAQQLPCLQCAALQGHSLRLRYAGSLLCNTRLHEAEQG